MLFRSPSIVPVTKVTLSSDHLSLNAGDTRTLTAAILPADATEKSVMWRSGNDSVARVDSSGKVTAISAGATVIVVTTMDGEFSAACVVTVTGSSSVTPSPSPDNPSPSQPMSFAKKELPASGDGSFADLSQDFKNEFVKPNGAASSFKYGEDSSWWVKIPYADGSRKVQAVSSVKLGDETLKGDKIKVSVGNNNHAEAPEYMITENGLYISLVFIALHNVDSDGEMKFTITEASGVTSTAVLKVGELNDDLKCIAIERQYQDGTATVEVASASSATNSSLPVSGKDSVSDSNGITSCTLQLLAGYDSGWKHMVYLTFEPSAEYYFTKKVINGNTTYGFSPQDDSQGRLGLYPIAAAMGYTVASVTRHALAKIVITANAPASAASVLKNIGRR